MNFQTSVETCFRKYFDFSGRARRSEFWYFYLFAWITGLILGVADSFVFDIPFGGADRNSSETMSGALFSSPMSDTFSLLTFIPIISASARRLHDLGKSGWYLLMPFIPLLLTFVGMHISETSLTVPANVSAAMIWGFGIITLISVVVLIVWLATDSHEHENRYGLSPKYDDKFWGPD